MKSTPGFCPHAGSCFAKLSLIALFLATGAVRAATVYVSVISTGGIEEFNSSTGADLGAFATGMTGGPVGLAFDNAGNLYSAIIGQDKIVQITPGGVNSVFASTGLSSPVGLAFDSAGNLYVANNGSNTIEKFTPGGVGSLFANTGLSGPNALAFDSAGNLYAANNNNSTIEKFTPGGVGSLFANTGLDNPTGLAFDSAGNLYAANYTNSTIEKFTPGGVGSVFASTGLFGPEGLAFDSAGNLYAANQNSPHLSIEKFTSGGAASLFSNSASLNGTPQFIAFQPAALPEPSCVLLLLGGLGAIMMQRRRNRPTHSPTPVPVLAVHSIIAGSLLLARRKRRSAL